MTAGPKLTDMALVTVNRVATGANVEIDLKTQLRSLVRVSFPTVDASNLVTLAEAPRAADGSAGTYANLPNTPAAGAQDYFIEVESNDPWLRVSVAGPAGTALVDVYSYEGKLKAPQAQTQTIHVQRTCAAAA